MKKAIYLVAVPALFILCTACPGKKSMVYANKLFFPMIIDAKFQAPKKHPVHIDSVYIVNDILNLKVNYSGGCKAHFFQLYTNGAYSNSTPPQLNVFLNDTVKTDACRQFKEELIKFEISKLKHTSQKSVTLKFGDGIEAIYSY